MRHILLCYLKVLGHCWFPNIDKEKAFKNPKVHAMFKAKRWKQEILRAFFTSCKHRHLCHHNAMERSMYLEKLVLVVDSRHPVPQILPFHCSAVFCWEYLNPDMYVTVDLLKHTYRPDHQHTPTTPSTPHSLLRKRPEERDKYLKPLKSPNAKSATW